jgi:hypothetical protein
MVSKKLLVAVLLFLAGTSFAGDQNFPVGMWFSDAPIVEPNNWWATGGFPPEIIAQLRWHGMDIGTAGGSHTQWNDWLNRDCSRNVQKKLARYDSLGYRIWLVVNRFHFSWPKQPCPNPPSYCTPTHDGMDVNGHNVLNTNPLQSYFISQGRSRYPGGAGERQYQNPDPAEYRTKEAFDTYLNSAVNSVVDSVKNYHAFWRYFWWDEFNGAHVWRSTDQDPGEFYWYQQTYMRYWENLWMDSTNTDFVMPDSMSVHSWMKRKVELRDQVHSVCQNLGATEHWGNAVRTYTTLKYYGPQGQTASNKPKSFAFDVWPYYYTPPLGPTPIGDSSALKNQWTSWQDTAVAKAKAANPSDPIKIYMTQLQHIGTCYPNPSNPNQYRIPTPEEVRELVNLAVLHEMKGIFYFVYPSGPYGNAHSVDENYVPFDTSYEEYVYNRNHPGYYAPNKLSPFYNFADSIHDPFRVLPNPPDSTVGERGKENYNLWKSAPYARNWNFMKTINDPLRTITPHLPDLWKVSQRITSVVPDAGVSTSPEYVTFADSVLNHPPTAFYAFIVSKDFNSTQRSYIVTVNGSQLPQPPIGQRYYVLDLNSRHLVSSTGNIVFHTVLKPGEGRLFRFIIGPQPAGGGGAGAPLAPPVPNPYNGSMWSTLLVTDPDVSFYKSGQQPGQVQFTEVDTVVLSAVVYNLGFSAKSDTVKFYIGDPLSGGTFLGKSYVTVPALSPDDTLPKYVTVTYNWVTNSSTPLGPKDINVFLKGASSSAHSLLWLNAEDYATKVNNSPWDMTETKPNQDIASYTSFVNLTDSISGVWEGMTNTMPPPPPTLHFRLASLIDASKYKTMQFRIFSDQAESVTVRWYPLNGDAPGMNYLPPSQWQVVTVKLGDCSGWSGLVTDFFLQFPSTGGTNNCKIRLAWAKLTTR